MNYHRLCACVCMVICLTAGGLARAQITSFEAFPTRGGAAGGISGLYAPGVKAAQAFPVKPRSARDFSGVWVGYRKQDIPPKPSVTPAAAAILEKYDDANDSPSAQCLSGWPRILAQPYPVEVIQTPDMTLFWSEAYNTVKRVWTDGRKHDPDWDLSFYGESVGHWEGNTLVSDTVGLLPQTMGLGIPGSPLSDAAHTVERWTMIEQGRALQVEVTIEDPKYYTKPFTYKKVFDRTTDKLHEYICNQNNRNDPAKGHVPGNLLAPPGATNAP